MSRWIRLALLLLCCPAFAQDEATNTETDFLNFANGALPVALGGDAEALRVGQEHALEVVDGNPAPFLVTRKPAGADQRVSFTYQLPALTTFTRFGIPNIGETPSPSQTFFRHFNISVSRESPGAGFVQLLSGELETHADKDDVSYFDVPDPVPALWLRLELHGGIDMQREKSFLEFSELQGFGEQERVPMSERFTGKWKGRGVHMALNQEGTMVTGCYDQTGELSGAVTGNILRARGVGLDDGVVSLFLLMVADNGELQGVRSTNGAPFRLNLAQEAPAGTEFSCVEPETTELGCGDIIYGIQFAFDSAEILPQSRDALDALYSGLSNATGMLIEIEGHTSSEGSDAYNQSLSERRARSVVADLVARGFDAQRLVPSGKGESMPVADNGDEAGRALNRRVEVHCQIP